MPDQPDPTTREAAAMHTEATHLETPWHVNTLNGRLPVVRECKNPHGEAPSFRSTIRTADDRQVCVLDFGYGSNRDKATAEFVVHACNSHDALLAACEAAEALDLYDEDGSGFTREQLVQVIERAVPDATGSYESIVRELRRKAIALATGVTDAK